MQALLLYLCNVRTSASLCDPTSLHFTHSCVTFYCIGKMLLIFVMMMMMKTDDDEDIIIPYKMLLVFL